jgi:hypothetical protein
MNADAKARLSVEVMLANTWLDPGEQATTDRPL